MALPRPEQINVPAKVMLRCSVSGGAVAMEEEEGETSERAEQVLRTGVFSPVREDSSTVTSTASISRQSAGTRLKSG